MEIQLNKTILVILSLFLINCNGDAQNSKIKTNKEVQKTEKDFNFFDEKYSESLYSLIIDESNISDHPVKSYLSCKDEGYFSIHYIPKTEELKYFWKDSFLKNYDFSNIDLKKDHEKIQDLLKNKTNYNIFSYQITKEYLTSNRDCTEESIFAKKNAVAQIYYYNTNNKNWELQKEIHSEKLPPYIDSDFFVKNFPEYFAVFSSRTNSTQEIKWDGTYSLKIDYGKMDEFSEMAIDYNIEIKDSECTFSGMGYKTNFTDLCKIEEKNGTLILKYIKRIDGDGFSDHSKVNYLGTIIYKNDEYYLKSPIIADYNWNYDKEIKLTKSKKNKF